MSWRNRLFRQTDKKTSEFETALQIARGEISKENEVLRRQWGAEQTEALAQARADSEARVGNARTKLAAEIERAKSDLDINVDELSTAIVEALAGRRAGLVRRLLLLTALLAGVSAFPFSARLAAQDAQHQESTSEQTEDDTSKWKLINTGIFALILGFAVIKYAPGFFNARSVDIQKAN